LPSADTPKNARVYYINFAAETVVGFLPDEFREHAWGVRTLSGSSPGHLYSLLSERGGPGCFDGGRLRLIVDPVEADSRY